MTSGIDTKKTAQNEGYELSQFTGFWTLFSHYPHLQTHINTKNLD